jgi:hypothetical protein
VPAAPSSVSPAACAAAPPEEEHRHQPAALAQAAPAPTPCGKCGSTQVSMAAADTRHAQRLLHRLPRQKPSVQAQWLHHIGVATSPAVRVQANHCLAALVRTHHCLAALVRTHHTMTSSAPYDP